MQHNVLVIKLPSVNKMGCFPVRKISDPSFTTCKLHETASYAEIKPSICVRLHLTVAGDATSRSIGSKMRLICGDI